MKTTVPVNDVANAQGILARVLADGDHNLTDALAKYILDLRFSELDQARMQDLAERNQEGTLSPEEREDLFGYVKAGDMLALLQSNARHALKRRKVS